MGSSIVATGNNVKFIGGVTPLTQANWQEYFGTLEPNGIVSGFDFLDRGLSLDTKITDGKIYMNGILYSLDTNDGYTTIAKPTEEEVDTFICARVYFHEERIELIRKTNIAPATYYAQYIPYVEQFATDESYQCDRNSSFYELPIGYRVYRREIGDLRRFRTDDSEIIISEILQPVPVQSNRTYVIRGDSSNIRIYVDIGSGEASGEVPPYINPPTQVLKPTKKCKNIYFEVEITKFRKEKSRNYPGWHSFG